MAFTDVASTVAQKTIQREALAHCRSALVAVIGFPQKPTLGSRKMVRLTSGGRQGREAFGDLLDRARDEAE